MISAPKIDDRLDDEIRRIASEMHAADAAIIRSNGHKKGVDVMPPDDGVLRYDDLANSQRFLADIGSDLLYCAEEKKWKIWQGTHWATDREDFVFEYAEAFAQRLYSSANDKEAFKNAQRANNRSGFNAFLELAERKKKTSIEQFDDRDATGGVLNFKNGTLDLATGNLRPHAREDKITRCIPYNYDDQARSPIFNAFLDRIQPDDSVRAFLQRSIGYSLLGTVRERSFWILYGTGNNGKSIFTNLFNNLLGDYASTTTTASIMQSRQNAIPNDIARLKGKRFIVIPETEENERMNAALVKALSAGDKVSARFLFAEYFDFYFTGKLWIATNHKPTITDHSKGFWDRVKLVPFPVDIPEAEVNRDMMRDLMREPAGIIAWAVQGARDYFETDGLDVPAVIQAEIDRYRFEQDSIAQFIEEKCYTIGQARENRPEIFHNDLDFRISNGDLYEAYKKFCNANGEYCFSHRRLSRNMTDRGFKQHNSAGRYWEGIRLIDNG